MLQWGILENSCNVSSGRVYKKYLFPNVDWEWLGGGEWVLRFFKNHKALPLHQLTTFDYFNYCPWGHWIVIVFWQFCWNTIVLLVITLTSIWGDGGFVLNVLLSYNNAWCSYFMQPVTRTSYTFSCLHFAVFCTIIYKILLFWDPRPTSVLANVSTVCAEKKFIVFLGPDLKIMSLMLSLLGWGAMSLVRPR